MNIINSRAHWVIAMITLTLLLSLIGVSIWGLTSYARKPFKYSESPVEGSVSGWLHIGPRPKIQDPGRPEYSEVRFVTNRASIEGLKPAFVPITISISDGSLQQLGLDDLQNVPIRTAELTIESKSLMQIWFPLTERIGIQLQTWPAAPHSVLVLAPSSQDATLIEISRPVTILPEELQGYLGNEGGLRLVSGPAYVNDKFMPEGINLPKVDLLESNEGTQLKFLIGQPTGESEEMWAETSITLSADSRLHFASTTDMLGWLDVVGATGVLEIEKPPATQLRKAFLEIFLAGSGDLEVIREHKMTVAGSAKSIRYYGREMLPHRWDTWPEFVRWGLSTVIAGVFVGLVLRLLGVGAK